MLLIKKANTSHILQCAIRNTQNIRDAKKLCLLCFSTIRHLKANENHHPHSKLAWGFDDVHCLYPWRDETHPQARVDLIVRAGYEHIPLPHRGQILVYDKSGNLQGFLAFP